MSDQSKKTYGLIIPKKAGQPTKKSTPSTAFNVFGNESDEEDGGKPTTAPAKKYSGPSTVKRQTQMDIDKALTEDPTVYEYDSIYDDLQATKPQVGTKEKSSSEKKPRYISGLLKAAETKKKEDERRKERQVQKEREAEGEMFADKEKFVTSAYKQKMLEMAEAEEKEKREAALENLLDVTKQKDMSGFYRYLYRTTTGNEAQPEAGTQDNKDNTEKVKDEPSSPKSEAAHSPKSKTSCSPKSKTSSSPKSKTDSSSSSDSESSHESSDEDQDEAKTKVEFSKPNRPRHGGKFRQHRSDSSSPEPDRRGSKRPGPPPRRDSDPRRDRHGDTQRGERKRRSPSPGEVRHRSQGSRPDPTRRDPRDRSRSKERTRSKRSGSRDKRETHSKRTKRETTPPAVVDMVQNTSSPSVIHKDALPTEKENMAVDENVKSNSEVMGPVKPPVKEKVEPVDPRKKVYPHHNSPKDIAEARKRYLQRKIAREMAG